MTRDTLPQAPLARGPERFASKHEESERPAPLKALGAALALLVLVVGVPLALLVFTGPPPVPTHLPSRSDLTQPLSIDGLVVVLRVVVWLAWLQFTVCTVVELVGFVRGNGLPRVVPLSGRSQALARALIGTILMSGSFLGATGVAQATAPAAPTHTGVVATQGQSPTSAHQQQPGDRGAEEAPRMEHVPGVPSTMTDVIGHKVIVVQPPRGHYHDNLWDIAERHLGDGRRWKEIYELNHGRLQPDGGKLELARLIQPGWVMIMPRDATGAVEVHALPGDGGAAHHAGGAQDGAQAGHQQDAQGGAQGGDQAQHAADEVGPGTIVPIGAGLLGAVILGGLAAERRRRRGAALSDAEAEAEVALRVGADQDRVRRLDRALRGLSAACRAERLPLPQAYAATVDDTAVELRVAPPSEAAPAPWSAIEGGRRWRLEHTVDETGEVAHAPYPGLVCIGRDDRGADVLIDLESVGGLISIGGSASVANEVVSAMAVQLATAPWADQQRVVGYHLAPAVTGLGGAVELVDDIDAVVAEWEPTLPRRNAEDVLSGRLGRHPGAPPRYLVLGSAPTDDDTLARMGGLARSGGRGIGIVAAAPLPGSRWRMVVDESGRLSLPLLDVEVDAVRLAGSDAEALAALFEKAREEEVAPVASGRLVVAPTPRSGDDAHWSTAAVGVGVLGPIELRTEGELDPARLALVTELVVFLALQPAPVHPSVVGASVWPRGVTTEVRDATIARAREWLGKDADGNHLLGETAEGRLMLSEDVAVDWHAFCELVRRSSQAATREERALLRRALRLVRGELMADRPALRYSWLPRTRLEQTTSDLVVGAAHRLAELSFDDDPSGAAAACRAGLRLAPTSQILWRDLLSTGPRDPDGPGAAGLVDEMIAALHRSRAQIEPETEALIAELLPAHEAGRLA